MMERKTFFTILLAGCLSCTMTAQKKPKKELYVPMDYSTCGYHASESRIPDVDVAAFVAWQDGDCSPLIQQAIDQVSQLKPNDQGFRGAILLGEGRFRLDQPLRITASGIVLRGMNKQKTVLVKQGVERGAIVYIEGKEAKRERVKDTLFITADCIPAGSTSIPLPVNLRPYTLSVGDRINIVRPCTREWIESLGMNDFGGGLDYTGWKPTDIDITWDRIITAINGDGITLDAPITTTITQQYGGAFIQKVSHDGELKECGIENLTLESAVNDWNSKDEDHCWDGIFMNHVRDGWVRHVNFLHLAGSAVNLQKHTSRITVEDCIAEKPVSEIGGWRRQVFLTRGQQTLFQRCVSRQGIHDFAAGFCAAGPNAFVQCEGEESLGFSGSIGSWAAGLLFDIVNIDGHDLRFANLEQFQLGTGWNTANSMFWQCTASTIECYSPDTLNRSSAHGCWGTLTGNGEWTSSNDHVQPRSLFYDQLEKRTAEHPAPYLLPRSTNSTTSPTVEQAMEMAQRSLTQPRLTMTMWIDSVPFTASTALVKPIKYKPLGSPAPPRHSYSASPKLTKDGVLLTGMQYNIPWWNGRVKDNYCRREAKPAITRFVPGREGTGWTDRIDSVVTFLDRFHFSSLEHHYGLWYDLRRIDHERVRRADGDVGAPFYEQPFARCGEGTAWDGLSRYDLTKPNLWYWSRLNEFASKAAEHGILLYHQHYFQHNILEAGAHWVDCPWRPVNNVNGTTFPEPVPFDGDKRIFLAEQFYNEQDPVLRPLHRQYIRMCLDQLKNQPNVVHSISAEYTGPLHFTRFWLQTIAEWEQETGLHPLIALSCTKDVQDSLLADPVLSKVVDIIDIRYWHYNTEGLWAPKGGHNMAPRQWMRKMPAGKTGFDEAYSAVREYRDRYPDKAVTFYSQQWMQYGWAVLMAGGSLPTVRINNQQLLSDIVQMSPIDSEGCVALGNADLGYLVYTKADTLSVSVAAGKYDVYEINTFSGEVNNENHPVLLQGVFESTNTRPNKLFWLRKL